MHAHFVSFFRNPVNSNAVQLGKIPGAVPFGREPRALRRAWEAEDVIGRRLGVAAHAPSIRPADRHPTPRIDGKEAPTASVFSHHEAVAVTVVG